MQNSFDFVRPQGGKRPEQTMDEWKTKPSDRFVLKWIKINISARITPRLIRLKWLRPWMITLCSTSVGVFAGVVFALGSGLTAGLLAACAQVLDGVDGQFSRLASMQSSAGAFLDSVLDRYFDAALMIGLTVYLIRLPVDLPAPLVLVMAFFAVSGSTLISYTTARAESLGIPLGKPTLASKGTRMSVIVLCGWASILWAPAPILALAYLALHPNIVVFRRIYLAYSHSDPP
ncbi:MAG TPA: CDP-alcohol phosphatidyltransferase family protein [Syntrophobacteraceae bacterium]|nr:CDP-alcohol phosphatidyltransferase family protein [Syntrophobacteraceae bacterium]